MPTFRLKPFVLERWSIILPGVPTRTCGRLPRTKACCIMSIPPTRTQDFNPMPDPSDSNVSAIWIASSRAGATTSAKKGCTCFRSACMIGMANVPVLPEPVCASPTTSFPVQRDCQIEETTSQQAAIRVLTYSCTHARTFTARRTFYQVWNGFGLDARRLAPLQVLTRILKL